MFLLLLPLFSFLLTPSRASFNFSGIDLCSSLTPISDVISVDYEPLQSLTVVVDKPLTLVDYIHEAALTFSRLFCLIRPSTGRLQIRYHLHQSFVVSCCKEDENPYDFFIRSFGTLRIAHIYTCLLMRFFGSGKKLVFTGQNHIHCADSNLTFVVVNSRFTFPSQSTTDHFHVNVYTPRDIITVYEIALHLGGHSGDLSGINSTIEWIQRYGELDYHWLPPWYIFGLYYLALLVISMFIFMMADIARERVLDHSKFVVQQILRDRFRRHRLRMEEENEQWRRERRARRDSERRPLMEEEERSEQSVRTAISGRFPSVSSLSSWNSVESNRGGTEIVRYNQHGIIVSSKSETDVEPSSVEVKKNETDA